MTKAVIFVKSDDFDPHATRCTLYCEERGYEIAGVVMDDWGAVQQMLGDGQASVALVSTEEHLPAQRKPRIEVVANAISARWAKRTRVIRRSGGA